VRLVCSVNRGRYEQSSERQSRFTFEDGISGGRPCNVDLFKYFYFDFAAKYMFMQLKSSFYCLMI